MRAQKVSVVAGLAGENSGGRVTKAPMAFGKALLVDSRSALVAYLKCYYFLSYCN